MTDVEIRQKICTVKNRQFGVWFEQPVFCQGWIRSLFTFSHMRKVFRSMIKMSRNWKNERRSIRKFWKGLTNWSGRR